MIINIIRKWLALVLTLCAASPGLTASCNIPAYIPAIHAQKAGDVRNVPIGGYILALSWSPEVCFEVKRNPRDTAQDIALQCSKSSHFGFVRHGLWPEGRDKDWPQYCHPVTPLSPAIVRAELCQTPSVSLLEHEWEKHGSCGWQTPDAYFTQSDKLTSRVKLPDMSGVSQGQVNASAIRNAFVAANPGLPPAAVAVEANKAGWLNEVRLCLDTKFAYRACPSYSQGTPDVASLKVARLR